MNKFCMALLNVFCVAIVFYFLKFVFHYTMNPFEVYVLYVIYQITQKIS